MEQPESQPISFLAYARHFPIRIRPAVPMDDDALFELCRINRDLRIERTSEGELVIMSPTGGDTGRRNFDLIAQLAAWVARDGRGVGFDSSTGFVLPNGAERSPDAAWLRRDRWDALTPEMRRKFVPLCPDFVIEILSPSDSLAELQDKMSEWTENGAALGWLLDPEGRRAFAYRPGRPPDSLGWPDEISGDPEMPGLRFDLRRIM